MTRLVVTWLSNCAAIAVAAAIIGPVSYGGDVGTLLLAGLILGVVNFLLKPLVILFTLPGVILTLGLLLLLINAFMLWVTSKIVTGFHVGGFWSTVGAAIVVWLVNLVIRLWVRRIERDREQRRKAAPA